MQKILQKFLENPENPSKILKFHQIIQKILQKTFQNSQISSQNPNNAENPSKIPKILQRFSNFLKLPRKSFKNPFKILKFPLQIPIMPKILQNSLEIPKILPNSSKNPNNTENPSKLRYIMGCKNDEFNGCRWCRKA